MGYEPQPDFGTPAARSDKTVTLTIDGRDVTVPEGTSVMRAAAECGGEIPKLCATDMVKSFGSCRMCLVEVEGMRGTPASCTTPVADGMVVKTQTPRLEKLRRGVMELYISDHPLDCLTCSANNDCELQDTAAAVGLRDVRYGYDGDHHLGQQPDMSNPYFLFAPDKCIVCSRCVRACDEVQGTLALTVDGRGFESKISAGTVEDDFLSSECVSCGACVQACPTSALMEKSVKEHGKPERSVVTTCAYCGVGCTFRAEMRGEQLVRMVPWKEGKANRGHSCVKGRFAWGYANHQDRITSPMIRDSIDQPWREVSWDEAITYAASRLKGIRDQYGARALGGITSSRCTNEETFLVQKLVRGGFGSNNVDTCARVCHSPTGYGLKTTFGTSAGTQDFDSVEHSDVILVIGANPTDAHPVFASRMKRRLREGAKLIVIDPPTQYCKKPQMAILDFDKIEQKIKETLMNLKNESPDFWFTKELETFLQTQLNTEINQNDFNKWILKIKAMYLMLKEVQPDNLPENLPSTTPTDYIKDCLKELKANAPMSNLISIFSSAKSFKNITKEVQKSPPQDSRLKWFFDLQISDRGENVERSLIDKLYSLKDNDILKDSVILSSVNFLTEFADKCHQEFDFLIFSW